MAEKNEEVVNPPAVGANQGTAAAPVRKCECDQESLQYPLAGRSAYDPEEWASFGHKPGECRCTSGVKLYLRDGKPLWLCSACNCFGDIRMPTGPTTAEAEPERSVRE